MLVALFRLADDIESAGPPLPRPTEISTHPSGDAAFRSYAELLLSRMPAPTAEGLALRLRRAYPHALVQPTDRRWVILRDGSAVDGPADGWWVDAGLPRVRHDLDGLVLEANPAARQLLGEDIVGQHWQDLATPGAAPRVAEFMAIIERLGTVISRFRMPSASGALVEFDSFSQVEGSSVVTIMRPLSREAPDTMSA